MEDPRRIRTLRAEEPERGEGRNGLPSGLEVSWTYVELDLGLEAHPEFDESQQEFVLEPLKGRSIESMVGNYLTIYSSIIGGRKVKSEG